MPRARLWRSTPFRLAVTFGLVFFLTFVAAGFVTYQFMRRELQRSLDSSVADLHAVIASSDDLEDLIAMVDAYSRVNRAREWVFCVFGADGRQIAGDVSTPPLPDGFSTVGSVALGLRDGADYRAFSGVIGSNRLIVGRSYAATNRLEHIAFLSFVWATLVAMAGAIVGGVLLARKVQRRLDGIAGAMTAVSHGMFDARVPLRGNGDDIDVVSGQVNEALDRLSALMETMRQVSSDIAHELKTPLNRLRMQVEAAISGDERGENVTEALFDARAEAGQINATFEALLRISQIEAGARRTRFQSIDLTDLVASVGEIYAGVAEDSGHILSTSIEAGALTISGDRELLTQMFVNLVENAIRHCPPGAAISIALAREGDSAVVAVNDDGPGIPAGEREKVFRRLYRLDKSRTTDGSGLGLSLVRAIADLHAGAVSIRDNRPGVTAEVILPLEQPALKGKH